MFLILAALFIDQLVVVCVYMHVCVFLSSGTQDSRENSGNRILTFT